MLTKGILNMSHPQTSKGTPNVTSSPVSADGPMPSSSPKCQMTFPEFGRAVARVNHSPPSENAGASWTEGTCGPSSTVSSGSVALQLSLASRLQARLAGNGSGLYSMTWQEWIIGARERICALRGSVRPISGNACIGLPEPLAETGGESFTPPNANAPAENPTVTENAECRLCAPAAEANTTPAAALDLPLKAGNSRTDTRKAYGHDVGQNRLSNPSWLVGWATVTARDWKDTPGMATKAQNPDGTLRNRLDMLARQVCLLPHGTKRSSYSAKTEKPGLLSPEFCRWLMGYPPEWDVSELWATRFARKSRRCSSRKASKPS